MGSDVGVGQRRAGAVHVSEPHVVWATCDVRSVIAAVQAGSGRLRGKPSRVRRGG